MVAINLPTEEDDLGDKQLVLSGFGCINPSCVKDRTASFIQNFNRRYMKFKKIEKKDRKEIVAKPIKRAQRACYVNLKNF